jgi:hypothetical protein
LKSAILGAPKSLRTVGFPCLDFGWPKSLPTVGF